MRFCWRCGGELGTSPPVQCGRCGQRHWRNAKPAAAGLVVRDGRLLLVRRAHDPWRGAWCAPAGFCDADEHPILTAEREIYEESGIRARVTGFLGTWTGDYGDSAAGDDPEWISVAYYHAEPLSDAPGVPDGVETDEVRWFPFDDLPAGDELAPPGRFPSVLAAWRIACLAGHTATPLLDRPTG
jgi:8-oxo-dGTP pyrophosphatase MutT (NUDIX family)